MLSSLITLTRHHVYFNVNANEFKIEEQLFSQQNINFFFFFFYNFSGQKHQEWAVKIYLKSYINI